MSSASKFYIVGSIWVLLVAILAQLTGNACTPADFTLTVVGSFLLFVLGAVTAD